MRTTGNDMPLSVDLDRGQADSRQEGTSMTDNASVPRSRRALLAAAAGGAAALAASAALPLTAMADTDDPVLAGRPSTADATTGIAATGLAVGLEASSSESAGIVGWSIS